MNDLDDAKMLLYTVPGAWCLVPDAVRNLFWH